MNEVRILSALMIFVGLSHAIYAAPLIQKITNNTDFGLVVLSHSDNSSCSLQGKSIIIKPHTTFDHEFLLEVGQPSLVLRPVFYQDPASKEIAWLTDQNYNYQSDLVQSAYQSWKHQRSTYKYQTSTTKSPSSTVKQSSSTTKESSSTTKQSAGSERWLEHWVGKDLAIIPHQTEMIGYLINLSRITIHNNRNQHVQWMSFSKGIFSKLVLELTVFQYKRKGLRGKITIHHGEGGICSNGVVERITS